MRSPAHASGSSRLAAALALCSAVMIHGCDKAEPPPAQIVPQVVDLTRERCPDVDPATRAEAHKTTPRPAFDATDTDGTPGYSRDAVRKWISPLEVSEYRKNLALSRVIDQYERCRAGGSAGGRLPSGESPAPATSPPAQS